jgi:hypothetical protein
MRIHGRQPNPDGTYTWVTLDTVTGASIDEIYVLWLVQSLKLNTLESPFWPGWGVPIWQAMQNTFYPDSSIAQLQANFAQYFAYLSITRLNDPDPFYQVIVITKNGTYQNFKVLL